MKALRTLACWLVTLLAGLTSLGALPPYRVEPVADVEPTGEPWLDQDCPILCDLSYGPMIRSMKSFGDQVAFSAFNHELGKELWVSDGTEAGTHLVADLCSGSCYGRPVTAGNLSGELVFSASQGPNQSGLWATDGDNVRRIGEIRPSDRIETLELEGWLYIPYGRQVWGTDGNMTIQVSSFPEDLWLGELFHLRGRSFAHRREFFGQRSELWQFLPDSREILRACDLAHRDSFSNFVVLGEVALFGADCIDGLPNVSPGLFLTDGILEGTRRLMTFTGGRPDRLIASGGYVYFVSIDSNLGLKQLWRTNGTSEGTVPLTDPLPGLYEPLEVLRNRHLLVRFRNISRLRALDLSTGTLSTILDPSVNNFRLLALPSAGVAAVATYEGLWLTDGSAEGTIQVFDGLVGDAVSLRGNELLFAGENDGQGEDLWSLRVVPGPIEIPVLGPTSLMVLAGLLLAVAWRRIAS